MGNQSEAASPRRLRVFLCHAVEDKSAVRKLYQQLGNCNIDPWLDEEQLVGGQDWDLEIQKAVRKCDVVLICLSHKFLIKEGYGQKEIKIAIDTALEKPEGANYLIPLRLENCELPERLKRFQAINYFEGNGYDRLIRALEHRSKNKSESMHEEIVPIDCQPSMRANQAQVQQSTGPRMAESGSLHSNISGSTQRIKQRRIYIVVSLLIVIILIPLAFLLYNTHKLGPPTSPTTTQTTQTSIPNILGSYSGTHTFSGLGEPHQSMSLTINQQNGQSFSGTCMLQREYQIKNGLVDHTGDIHFTITAIRNEGGTTVVTFIGIAQQGGGWQGTFTDTVADTGTWNVVKTS